MTRTSGVRETGFCWFCGLPINGGLFCNDRCNKRYERKQVMDIKKATKNGKREGYGLAGSTH